MRRVLGWVMAGGMVVGMASRADAQVVINPYNGFPTGITSRGFAGYPTYYASPGSWPYYVTGTSTVWPGTISYTTGYSSITPVTSTYSSSYSGLTPVTSYPTVGYGGVAPLGSSYPAYGYSSGSSYSSWGYGSSYGSSGSGGCSCSR